MRFSHVTALVALLTITAVAFGAIAVAAEETDDEWEEIENSTFETTEDTTYVEFDVEATETFENTAEETVELTIYDEAEYNDSEVAEEPVLEETVTLDPNESVTHEYDVGTEAEDDLEPETEYRAIIEVEHSADHILSGFVAPDDESIGGVQFGDGEDGSPGFGAGVAVVAIAIAAMVARVRGGA